jgi:hypothetical protein
MDDLAESLEGFLDSTEPLQHAIGGAGKKAAHTELEEALGADRSFSGLRRRVRLSAGYDLGQPVVLNMRPKGLVILADRGRTRTTRILPRSRRGAQALAIPGVGVRAHAMSRPSRGHDVIDKTIARCEIDCPKAVEDELATMIRDL